MTVADGSAEAPVTFAVVTGGGTAGHVLPALAIMDRLVAAGVPRAALHHVGTTRGVEARLLPPTGFGHTLLDVDGLQRSLSARNLRRNLVFLPKLIGGTVRAWRLLGRLRPHVVVNVGGYASMPATFAAWVRRVPVVVVSYDQRPGLASRVTARFAACAATAFEGSPLRRARLTGAPIRPEIIAVDRERDRASAREMLGLPPDRFVVTVFGGSLGAKAINDAVAEVVRTAPDRADLCIHHITGDRWVAPTGASGVSAGTRGVDGIMYRVIGFDDRMAQLYAASDLMVTRAGASTIAELAATGTPAIVVPWPDAAENHQLDNARTLSDHGAAVLLEQRDLTGERLLQEIDALRTDQARVASIAAAARAAGARHRDDSLIEVILEVGGR
jgi:UDP-N-acetylglucosamine--N-acetylmuramyl-(pentapeptide) pyrophosphoryl-undecaprenol N-acetylglucosamine transferase